MSESLAIGRKASYTVPVGWRGGESRFCGVPRIDRIEKGAGTACRPGHRERIGHMKFAVEDLRKSFGEKQVLRDVSFSTESGRAFGLLGRNGAGKTTAIRIIMDVFPADGGPGVAGRQAHGPGKGQCRLSAGGAGPVSQSGDFGAAPLSGAAPGPYPPRRRKNAIKWLSRLSMEEYAGKKTGYPLQGQPAENPAGSGFGF